MYSRLFPGRDQRPAAWHPDRLQWSLSGKRPYPRPWGSSASYWGGRTTNAEVRGDRTVTQPVVQPNRDGPETGRHPPFLQWLPPPQRSLWVRRIPHASGGWAAGPAGKGPVYLDIGPTGRYPSLKMPNLRLLFPPLVATGSTGPFPSAYMGHPPRSSGWWYPATAPSVIRRCVSRRCRDPFPAWEDHLDRLTGGALGAPEGWAHRQPSQCHLALSEAKYPGFPSRTGSHSAAGEGGSGTHRPVTRDQNPGTSLLRVGGVLSLLHP